MKQVDRFAALAKPQGTGLEGDLSHAQATLAVAKAVVDNNAPINEAEGELEQAQLERETSASIAEAQVILENAAAANGEAQEGGQTNEAPTEAAPVEPAAPVVSNEGDEGDHEFRGDYHSDNQKVDPVTDGAPEIPAVTVEPESNDAPKEPVVFLGGTMQSDWRDKLIPSLKIDHYNPMVEIWTMESQQMEEQAKIDSDFNLFVITPKQSGFFSIAEATASAIRNPEKTLLAVLPEDDGSVFEPAQLKSMDAVADLIKGYGATVFNNLGSVAEFLNTKKTAPAEVPAGTEVQTPESSEAPAVVEPEAQPA